MVDRVIAHVRKEGYFVTEDEPTESERLAHPRVARIEREPGGYRAIRNAHGPSRGAPGGRRARGRARGFGPIAHLGGSLPLAAFDDVLGVPLLIVPIANHDDNQHTHDENLRLENLWDGIETFAALFAM